MNDIKWKNGEFETVTPESQGLSSEAIRSCLIKIKETKLNVHSFHIFRNGFLLAGGCAKPFDVKRNKRLYSTLKSVIVLAVYFLIQEGKLSLDDSLINYFEGEYDKKDEDALKKLTVRNLLMMSVGHDRDALREYHQSRFGIGSIPNTYRDGEQPDVSGIQGKSLSNVFFSMPFAHEPGEIFFYNNVVPEMVGMLVERVAGEEYISYLTPRLFKPLEITGYKVLRQNDFDGRSFNDGSTSVASINDLCKIALFYLQRGSWNGQQLLSKDLIDDATAYHMPTKDCVRSGRGMSELDEYGYGYQIWRNKFGGYRMVGGSGQTCMIMPEHNLVIVYTSFDRNTNEEGRRIDEIIAEYILKDMTASSRVENSVALNLLKKEFDAWSRMDFDLYNADKLSSEGVLYEDEKIIGKATLDSANHSISVTLNNEEEIVLNFGINGEYLLNGKGLGHTFDGYSTIYGEDTEKVFVAGGMKDDTLMLKLQYLCGMSEHIIEYK